MNKKSKQGIGNKRNLQKLLTWDKALYPKIYIKVITQMDRNPAVRRKEGMGSSLSMFQ